MAWIYGAIQGVKRLFGVVSTIKLGDFTIKYGI